MNSQGVKEVCQALGFNLVGVAALNQESLGSRLGSQIRSILPQAQSAWIMGTGGGGFWSSLSGGEKKRNHPINLATVRRTSVVGKKLKESGALVRVVFPFRTTGTSLSFRRLAEVAGLGVTDTVLGILIHPVFGPWVSLRAVILTEEVWEPDVPLKNFLPCAPCSKPCISACPAQAMRASGFEARSCGWHVTQSRSCDSGCLSRQACVYGKEHAYRGAEAFHRQKFATDSLVQYVREK